MTARSEPWKNSVFDFGIKTYFTIVESIHVPIQSKSLLYFLVSAKRRNSDKRSGVGIFKIGLKDLQPIQIGKNRDNSTLPWLRYENYLPLRNQEKDKVYLNTILYKPNCNDTLQEVKFIGFVNRKATNLRNLVQK